MTFTEITHTLPPGLYVIADPCHVLEDDVYLEWIDRNADDLDYQRGTLPSGREAVAFSTGIGDGLFDTSVEGYRVGVDAGVIGLFPVEDVRADTYCDFPVFNYADGAECVRLEFDMLLGYVVVDLIPALFKAEEAGA